ncbi:MAG TPA: beta-L-arabinofuranosidase domain-containing protein [Bryobacteraceae bacterium]|nr:beta-L-arabinofuranosidase domain-containing protein [Bryobacteraceae bacterium]
MQRFILAFILIVPISLPAETNRPPLQPAAFNLLPLGSVKPKGWLLDQLKIQADGLSGHLDEFWPDVGPNSGWLGGTGESWERGPYFLDGLVPLAYLTNDSRLITKVKKWMDWSLDHQQPDGWLGPVKNTDWWPNFVMLKALTQYQEATGDPRVIPAMEKYFAYQSKHIDERPLKSWADYRWQDEVLSLIWLYNRNGDRTLLDLARKLHEQGHKWEAQFADLRWKGKVTRSESSLSTHGVNNAMALKTAPVWWLITGNASDRDALGHMLDQLDRYDGEPNGIFSSDEHYAGTDPSQGTELCAVVEAMFSLENDLAILGNPALGDRLEKIAFNALPGTFSPDMWAHQYDQESNQVMCSLSDRRWTTNNPDSNIFGLEPNFGCCTANMHQGWPKFAAHLWMGTPEGGFAAAVFSPSQVTKKVHNVPVTIDEDTGYPFREVVSMTVYAATPEQFDLQLRIPGWAEDATISVNGIAETGVEAGAFHRIARKWKDGDKIEIHLPMTLRVSHWYNNSVAIERGSIVYSLKIGESWREEKQTGPAKDWEVFPTTPWNYALVIDPKAPARSLTVAEKVIARQPFAPGTAPVEISAEGRRLPEWQLVDDAAGPLPASPVESKLPVESITLIPYGAAKLRITAFPYMLP